MATTKNKKISPFPQDDRLWKVNWIANVTINEPARSEPLITIFLSRIKANLPFPIDLKDRNNFDKEYYEAKIGVGHLSLVYIGSVWKNGFRVAAGTILAPSHFKINTSYARPLTFDAKPNGIRLITPYEYPTGLEAFNKIRNSPIIAIPYAGNPYGLLIPAIEIIRFYYLVSSPMARAIFYGVFDRLTKDSPTYNLATKHIEFTLNWGVGENNVWNIARYHSSELTKQRITDVYDWVRINSVNGFENKSLSTFLPFDGDTELSFLGMKVKGAMGKTHYLCNRILSCSGKFNFETVTAFVLKPDSQNLGAESEGESSALYWPLYEDKTDDELVSNEEPSLDHVSKEFIDAELRFTDLETKQKVIQKDQKTGERSTHIIKDVDDEARKLSTAEGTHGDSDTRKADISIDLDPNELNESSLSRLEQVINLLKYLRAHSTLEVKTLKVFLPYKFRKDKGYAPVKNMSIFNENIIGCFKVGNQKNNWVEIEVENKIKSRGIVIAQVMKRNKFLYLMELENDIPGSSTQNFSLRIQYKKNLTPMSNDELYDFIYRCGVSKRWPQFTKSESAIFTKKSLHHSGSYFNERVLETINSSFREYQ